MSQAAKKAAEWLTYRNPEWATRSMESRIDQAADEKYRPLVEAAENVIRDRHAVWRMNRWSCPEWQSLEDLDKALEQVKEKP